MEKHLRLVIKCILISSWYIIVLSKTNILQRGATEQLALLSVSIGMALVEVMQRTVFCCLQVDCNLCRCRNGRVSCTHTRCEEEEEEDTPCMRCRFSPRDPVCGPDGRTYQSRCYATECVGLSSVQLLPGPCTRYVRHIVILVC